MDQESLFTASKWDILEQIQDTELSPIEIADRINTSLANISQQLRLLEIAGIVKSRRVSNRDKGQPRILYSLNKASAFVICTSPEFVAKKNIELDDFKRATLRCWFYEKQSQCGALEKLLWAIEKYLEDIERIYVDKKDNKNIHLIIISKKKFLVQNVSYKGEEFPVKLSFISESEKQTEFESNNYYMIFSKNNLQKNMRGRAYEN